MDKFAFTKRSLEGLDLPSSEKRATYHDSKIPGLVIRVTPAGVKSFYLYKKVLGRPRRILIGHFPDLTPEQARAKAVELVGKIARGEDPEKKIDRQARTLNDLWEQYSTAKIHLRRLSDQTYWYKRYLRDTIGAMPLGAITARNIDSLSGFILSEGKRSTTVHVLEVFKRLIKFGVDRGICSPLPFKVPIPRYDDRKTENLTPEQIRKLLDVLVEWKDRQVADLVRLSFCTGMRKNEMLKLRWDDIDFERCFITIRDPKGIMAANIPINESSKSIFANIARTDSPFVFPNPTGGQRQRNAFARQLRQIRTAAGIPEDFRPLHGLRHVYASILASSGKVDMYTLQKLLTHKSPQMTQRYAHLHDDALRRAAAVVDDIFPK